MLSSLQKLNKLLKLVKEALKQSFLAEFGSVAFVGESQDVLFIGPY